MEHDPAAETAGYVLKLDYRDPFLEGTAPRKSAPSRSTGAGTRVTEEVYIQPPGFRFKGVIRQAGTLYAIIEAGTGTEILRRGETAEQFHIHTITADSVILQNGKHRFILYAE